jgi:hypothetical protein
MPSRTQRRDHLRIHGIGSRIVLQEHPARCIEAGIGFVQIEAAGHAHEMLDLDLAPRIGGAAPFRNRRGHRGRDKALLGEDADQRVDHRLGHGEAEQRGVDADACRIALGDYLTVVNHDDRLGPAERRCCRLLEGMVERCLQRRIGWFDHDGPGNLGKQRRRLRFQRLDVALQEIGCVHPVQIDAAEPVVKGGAAAK